MRVNNIQTYNNNSKPSFGIGFYPSQSLRYAVYTSRDLMEPTIYSKENERFLRKFYNSLAKIIKSKKADYISVKHDKKNNLIYITEVSDNSKYGEKCKEVLSLNCKQTKNNKFGKFFHTDKGANAMKALIKYAKTIKDVPNQNLKLKQEDLRTHGYNTLLKYFNEFSEILYI